MPTPSFARKTVFAVAVASMLVVASSHASGHAGGSSGGGSTPTTYSSDAEVLDVNVTLLNGFTIPIHAVVAGPIPVTGGYSAVTVVNIPPVALNLVSTQDASALAEAGPNAQPPAGPTQSHTFAGVSSTTISLDSVLPGALNITADVIQATADAVCDSSGNADVSGNSLITNLVINGNVIAITGQPNQTITIPQVASIVINEQNVVPAAGSGPSTTGSMTVNAIDIYLIPPGGLLGPVIQGNIIVSHAHADIECGS
jgi:hypothetical protein